MFDGYKQTPSEQLKKHMEGKLGELPLSKKAENSKHGNVVKRF